MSAERVSRRFKRLPSSMVLGGVVDLSDKENDTPAQEAKKARNSNFGQVDKHDSGGRHSGKGNKGQNAGKLSGLVCAGDATVTTLRTTSNVQRIDGGVNDVPDVAPLALLEFASSDEEEKDTRFQIMMNERIPWYESIRDQVDDLLGRPSTAGIKIRTVRIKDGVAGMNLDGKQNCNANHEKGPLEESMSKAADDKVDSSGSDSLL